MVEVVAVAASLPVDNATLQLSVAILMSRSIECMSVYLITDF